MVNHRRTVPHLQHVLSRCTSQGGRSVVVSKVQLALISPPGNDGLLQPVGSAGRSLHRWVSEFRYHSAQVTASDTPVKFTVTHPLASRCRFVCPTTLKNGDMNVGKTTTKIKNTVANKLPLQELRGETAEEVKICLNLSALAKASARWRNVKLIMFWMGNDQPSCTGVCYRGS